MTWLLTDRCRPAWVAVHALLADGRWHDQADVVDAMVAASQMAPQTVRNHLRSASHRQWITRRAGRVRLRDQERLEQALDQPPDGPQTSPRPTSSSPRPRGGDDLVIRPRPSSPSPLGDEVETESSDDHPEQRTSSPLSGTRSATTTRSIP